MEFLYDQLYAKTSSLSYFHKGIPFESASNLSILYFHNLNCTLKTHKY